MLYPNTNPNIKNDTKCELRISNPNTHSLNVVNEGFSYVTRRLHKLACYNKGVLLIHDTTLSNFIIVSWHQNKCFTKHKHTMCGVYTIHSQMVFHVIDGNIFCLHYLFTFHYPKNKSGYLIHKTQF